MIRCVRLWSGPDGKSHFEEGAIDLESGPRGDMLSHKFPIASVSFRETDADPKLGWHPDPGAATRYHAKRRAGVHDPDGRFSLRAGDILFTEDTVAGHDWKLFGEQPWRRVYAILDQATVVPFRPTEPRSAAAGPESPKAKASTETGAGL